MSDGLYIHRRTEKMPSGTRTMTVEHSGESQEWVHADDFMAVQKERDDAVRALALINAWRWSPAFANRDFRDLDTLLRRAGLDPDQGKAMLSLIASVRRDQGAALSAPDQPRER